MKKINGVVKLNFKYTRLALWISLGAVLGQGISDFINLMVSNKNSEAFSNLATGWYFFLYPLLAAVFIPSMNYRRFMNINVKKANYIKGTAITYVIMSAIASTMNTIWYFVIDTFMINKGAAEVWNMISVFKWENNPAVVFFFRQFAFILLVSCFVHLITDMQTFWYGWVVDALLIAIISVFVPIAPLRKALVWFFNLIIFQENAFLQIIACLILASIFYALSTLSTKQRKV